MATSHKSKSVVVEYNPYSQKIRFFKDDKESNKLKKLADEKDFFLQTKMDEVIKQLLNVYAYQKNELNITFNGIKEDFDEFKAACEEYVVKKKDSRKITVTHGERLPSPIEQKKKIDTVFNTLKHELIDGLEGRDKTECEEYIQKYNNASSSEVNIVVFGIYNSGKSALINAVLGYKILPTETTDKTKFWTEIRSGKPRLKIKVNDNSGGLGILSYNVEKSEDGYKLSRNQTENMLQNNDFIAVTELLEEVGIGQDFSDVIYNALDILTDENKKDENKKQRRIQSVKVWIPFDRTAVNKNIVFIDLPGKGSADKQSGKEFINNIQNSSISIPLIVLGHDAAAGENDIPSLLEKYGANVDNSRKIYIINKADACKTLKEIEKIKKDFKKNFTSQYMMTSALMGLEAKLQKNGYGDDDDLEFYLLRFNYFSEDKDKIEEMWTRARKKYDDEKIQNAILRSQLYKHNYIWNPSINEQCEQYKRKNNNAEDKIYVNSGIFAVEQMLNKFAETYAACYKCQKAKEYVLELADKVQVLLENNKAETDRTIRKNIEDKNAAAAQLKSRLESFISEDVKKQRKQGIRIEMFAEDQADEKNGVISHLGRELLNKKNGNRNEINTIIEKIEKRLNIMLDDVIHAMEKKAKEDYEGYVEQTILKYVEGREEFSKQVEKACRDACEVKICIHIRRIKRANLFKMILTFFTGHREVEKIAEELNDSFKMTCKENGQNIVDYVEDALGTNILELTSNREKLEDANYVIKKYKDAIEKLKCDMKKIISAQNALEKIKNEIYGGQI